MLQPLDYIQLRAYARQYGAVIGLVWVAGFVSFANSAASPGLSLVFDLSLVTTPFLATWLVSRYRDTVLAGRLSFRRAYAISLLTFLYAMLIMAAAQWAYLEFIDGGRLFAGISEAVRGEDFNAVLDAYGLTRKEMNEQLQTLATVRPIDFAFSFIWINGLAAIVISWVVALFTKRSRVISNS